MCCPGLAICGPRRGLYLEAPAAPSSSSVTASSAARPRAPAGGVDTGADRRLAQAGRGARAPHGLPRTIYAFIHRAGQKGETLETAAARRTARRRARQPPPRWRRRSIRDQPPGGRPSTRAKVGHWEGDLLICRGDGLRGRCSSSRSATPELCSPPASPAGRPPDRGGDDGGSDGSTRDCAPRSPSASRTTFARHGCRRAPAR